MRWGELALGSLLLWVSVREAIISVRAPKSIVNGCLPMYSTYVND